LLPWNTILNVGQDIVPAKELKLLALIAFSTFGLSFLLRLITTILTADQRPALASIFDLIGKVFSILIIIILIKTTQGSLLYLGIVQSCMPVLVLMVSSFWFFRGKYRKYQPSLRYIEFSKASDLLNLGIKFFILNIAVLLLYQTNNIIIAQLFGPKEVTPYNVAYTYYGVLTMGFGIIITPFWSAFTEAWVKKEISWIKNMMRNLIFLWVAFVITGMIMVVSSQWIFAIWIGNRVHVPYLMSFLVCAWVLLNAWNGIYSSLLNGIGKIKLQMYLGISAAIINVPLAIFLGKAIGIEGILLANVLLTLAGVFIYPLQYKNIINDRAIGLWNK
jgi:O-antigen/teichoic acid export membrane protein